MKRLRLIIAALGGLALLAGCASEDNGAYLPVNVTVNDLENRTTLVLLDANVQNAVTCPGVQETQLPDGRLRVAAHLRNRTEKQVRVQANCEFKDEQGFVIDATPFQNVFLDENAQQDVQFTAMNDKVQKYTIRVRAPR